MEDVCGTKHLRSSGAEEIGAHATRKQSTKNAKQSLTFRPYRQQTIFLQIDKLRLGNLPFQDWDVICYFCDEFQARNYSNEICSRGSQQIMAQQEVGEVDDAAAMFNKCLFHRNLLVIKTANTQAKCSRIHLWNLGTVSKVRFNPLLIYIITFGNFFGFEAFAVESFYINKILGRKDC